MLNMYEPSDRDWTEDYGHENGKYLCTCHAGCGKVFIGYKRRIQCKVCATEAEKRAFETALKSLTPPAGLKCDEHPAIDPMLEYMWEFWQLARKGR